MEDQNIINIIQAGQLYRTIVGRSKSHVPMEELIRRFPHLGLFEYDPKTDQYHLIGIRRDRWRYFLTARLALYGPRYIFNAWTAEGL